VNSSNFLTESSLSLLVFHFIQLKEMMEKLPPEALEGENWKTILTAAEDFLRDNVESETPAMSSSANFEQQNVPHSLDSNDNSSKLQEQKIEENAETEGDESSSRDEANVLQKTSSSLSNNDASMSSQNSLNYSKSQVSSRSIKEGETQVIEQFEPGVYVTLIVKPNGAKVFKRVRFRLVTFFLSSKFYIFNFYVNMHCDYV